MTYFCQPIKKIFKEILNTFTIELETASKKSLNFLDMTRIRRYIAKLSPIGTEVIYYSNSPTKHKIDTIYCLIDRAIICSEHNFTNKTSKKYSIS